MQYPALFASCPLRLYVYKLVDVLAVPCVVCLLPTAAAVGPAAIRRPRYRENTAGRRRGQGVWPQLYQYQGTHFIFLITPRLRAIRRCSSQEIYYATNDNVNLMQGVLCAKELESILHL